MVALAPHAPGIGRMRPGRGAAVRPSSDTDPIPLAAVLDRLNAAPLRPREALLLRGKPVGSVEVGLFEQLIGVLPADFPLWRMKAAWNLDGDDTDLATLADTLRAQGLCGPWRQEFLAVRDARGQRLGRIERGTARVLGLPTQAVHLIGRTQAGDIWVQQRAHTKAEDPGLWDTLVGGLVADGETALEALARETMEEAGLALAELGPLHRGPSLQVRCPTRDASGRGWRDEQLDALIATVPERLQPVNRDGEVAAFALLCPTELRHWLLAGRFTADATALLGLTIFPERSLCHRLT